MQFIHSLKKEMELFREGGCGESVYMCGGWRGGVGEQILVADSRDPQSKDNNNKVKN